MAERSDAPTLEQRDCCEAPCARCEACGSHLVFDGLGEDYELGRGWQHATCDAGGCENVQDFWHEGEENPCTYCDGVAQAPEGDSICEGCQAELDAKRRAGVPWYADGSLP